MLAIPSGNLIDENRTKILINCEQIYMEKKLTTYIILISYDVNNYSYGIDFLNIYFRQDKVKFTYDFHSHRFLRNMNIFLEHVNKNINTWINRRLPECMIKYINTNIVVQ